MGGFSNIGIPISFLKEEQFYHQYKTLKVVQYCICIHCILPKIGSLLLDLVQTREGDYVLYLKYICKPLSNPSSFYFV